MKKIYVKDGHEVTVSSKFIYCSAVYRIWKTGASLVSEKYYRLTLPLNIKKIPMLLKRKNYSLQRYFTLESAPKNYLITQGYKLK